MNAAAQIFLSYAREDAQKVESLYQQLSDAGFRPWMDIKNILPGEKWQRSIQHALQQSQFFLVERGDERAPDLVASRASMEIVKPATQLKVATIMLHPFAHLFGELSTPEVAISVLSRTQQALIKAGLQTYRTPFGWFNTLQIDAKGHPLSRVARIVTADE